MADKSENSRGCYLGVRITEPLHTLLKDAAERSGRPMSDWARSILIDAVVRELEQQGQ